MQQSQNEVHNQVSEKEVGDTWKHQVSWDSCVSARKIELIAQILSSKTSDWRLRCITFDLLQEVSAEESGDIVAAAFEQFEMVKALSVQIAENRSLVVKAVCAAIAAIAVNMDTYFVPFSQEIVTSLYIPLKNTKIVFRKSALQCLETLTKVPSALSNEAIDYIVSSAIDHKSAEVRKSNVILIVNLLKARIPFDKRRMHQLLHSALSDPKPEVRHASKVLFKQYMESRRMEANEFISTLSEKQKKHFQI